MQGNVIEFMVMRKSPDGEWEGLGRRSFAVAPRTGEYVTLNDENGKGQAYRVKAVIHPLEMDGTAGDLVLEYVSTDADMRKGL
jgi:hypothetical protein